jgi:hypothetical protein
MSDVADILGIQSKPVATAADEAARIMADKSKNKLSKSAKKPKGMKREVYDLLGEDGLLPAVQTSSTPAFKNKRQVTYGKWIWAPIESSARNDNPNPIFFHWVKADMHYSDYPYAKYNVHGEKLSYSEEEYNTLLKDPTWTREDTDQLLDTCSVFGLKWSIVYDRLQLGNPRPVEEVMARYYSIANALANAHNKNLERPPPIQALSITEKKSAVFDLERESKRRRQQDILFRRYSNSFVISYLKQMMVLFINSFRTKEEEQEEIRVKEEIKAIDAILKKNKKTVKSLTTTSANTPVTPASALTVPTPSSSLPFVKDESKSSSGLPMEISSSSATATPGAGGGNTTSIEGREMLPPATITSPSTESYIGPQRNKPCLQSTRLYMTDNNLQLSKSLMTKMKSYLTELNIPERPVPTKRVCDLVDQIRKSTVSLMSLHNNMKKKEKEISVIKNGPQKGTTKTTSRSNNVHLRFDFFRVCLIVFLFSFRKYRRRWNESG